MSFRNMLTKFNSHKPLFSNTAEELREKVANLEKLGWSDIQ